MPGSGRTHSLEPLTLILARQLRISQIHQNFEGTLIEEIGAQGMAVKYRKSAV